MSTDARNRRLRVLTAAGCLVLGVLLAGSAHGGFTAMPLTAELDLFVTPRDLPPGKYTVTAALSNQADGVRSVNPVKVEAVTAWKGKVSAPAFTMETAAAPPDGHEEKEKEKEKEKERKVVEVKTAEELVQAFGPDREVRLAAGEYNLAKLKQRKMEFVRWGIAPADDDTLTVRHVSNLTVRGLGEKRVRIIVEEQYARVLNFEDVKGVTLENLELGHAPKPGFCTGSVLGLTRATDFIVRNCDLFGCGTYGLEAEKVAGLTVTGSVIRDCTYGIMILNGCERTVFEKSTFSKNREFDAIEVRDSAKVEFRDCRIEDNVAGKDADFPCRLFKVVSSSDVTMTGGTLRRNRGGWLLNRKGGVTFKDIDSAENKFSEGEFEKE